MTRHRILLGLLGAALLFWVIRFLMGRYMGDAAHVLAGAVALSFLLSPQGQGAHKILGQGSDTSLSPSPFWKKTFEKAHFIFFEKPTWGTAIFFFYLVLSHALWGLYIHTGYGYDITFFVQAAFNAFHESLPLYKTFPDAGSFFAHHFQPYLFLLHPVAKWPESPFLFYVIQDAFSALFLLLSAKFIARWVVEKVDRVLLILLLLVNPFWSGLVHYEFHELALAPALIMGSVLLATPAPNSPKPMPWAALMPLVFLMLALLSLKETVVLTGIWAGVLFLCFPKGPSTRHLVSITLRHRVMGAIFACLALACAYLYFVVIKPQYQAEGFRFMGYYSNLGSSLKELVLAPVLKPLATLGALLQPVNFVWLGTWLISVALLVLPLKAGVWLLFVAPEFAMILLAQSDHLRQANLQYGGVILPVIFCAAVVGFHHLSRNKWGHAAPDQRKAAHRVLWLRRLLVCLVIWFCNPRLMTTGRDLLFDPAQGLASRDWVVQLQHLPTATPVHTNVIEVLPHLAKRDNLIYQHGSLSAPNQSAFVVHRVGEFANAQCSEVAVWQHLRLCEFQP